MDKYYSKSCWFLVLWILINFWSLDIKAFYCYQIYYCPVSSHDSPIWKTEPYNIILFNSLLSFPSRQSIWSIQTNVYVRFIKHGKMPEWSRIKHVDRVTTCLPYSVTLALGMTFKDMFFSYWSSVKLGET